MTPQQHPDVMVSRIPQEGEVITSPVPASAIGAAGRPPFVIKIANRFDDVILVLREDSQGRLVVEGDESRWDEGAKRFLHGLMQWSGSVGVRWKDEVLKAVEG